MSRKPLHELSQKQKRRRLSVLLRGNEAEVNEDHEEHRDANIINEPDLRGFMEGESDVEYEEEREAAEVGNGEHDNLVLDNEEEHVDVAQLRVRVDSGEISDENAEDIGRSERGDRSESEEEQNMQWDGSEQDLSDSEEEVLEEADGEQDHEQMNIEGPPINDDWQNYRPLYQGAPLTVGESMLMILALMLKHDLNMLCIADIIAVMNLHCQQQGLKKNSLGAFERYFALDTSPVNKYFFCSKCHRSLQSVDDACPSCPRTKNCYFIELPFINQLQEMYQRQEFYNLLQQRFNRPDQPPGNISDVYDSSLYKEWVENGFLRDPNNISFTWYTDGIPVFKSSQISVWPLYLSINELPFEYRRKIENTLLVGLWFGDTKPEANLFVQKFRPQMEEMAHGVNIHLPQENRAISVRGMVLMGTCDLPAKAAFLNFTQFNGLYGCPVCYCSGHSEQIGPRSHVWVYPYDPEPHLRTSDECENYARIASPEAPVMGVRGPTAWSRIMPDFVRGMAIDRMHGIEGGVVQKMLDLFFDIKYRTYPFSLHRFKDLIDSKLTTIKPPKFVHRMPRSVDDLTHWKASELKMWFFYYSIPVLEGILRGDFFQHYLLLVTALFLLNSDTITPQMREIAIDFLHRFVREFENLYGLRFCSLNIHQLLHLPSIVLNLGPLWAYSCFQFEDLNGQFLKLVHGTWHLETQIARKHEQIIAMVRMVERLPEGRIKDFCLSRKRQVKLIENVLPRTYSAGKYKRLIEIPDMISQALLNGGYEQYGLVFQYEKLLKDKKLYVSKIYPRVLQTESYVVKYVGDHGDWALGAIHSFIKLAPVCNCLEDCGCRATHLAIINVIETDDSFDVDGDNFTHNTAAFLIKCHLTDDVKAILVASLYTVCVHMNLEDQMYVGIPVNEQDVE